jgi:hypothetical protein
MPLLSAFLSSQKLHRWASLHISPLHFRSLATACHAMACAHVLSGIHSEADSTTDHEQRPYQCIDRVYQGHVLPIHRSRCCLSLRYQVSRAQPTLICGFLYLGAVARAREGESHIVQILHCGEYAPFFTSGLHSVSLPLCSLPAGPWCHKILCKLCLSPQS